MEQSYTIGNVSQKVGLSRDTLRFYEKKGIIKPKKLENGYRTYTDEDILHLMKIMFYRNIHFSIDEIQNILWHGSYQEIISQVQAKIDEETSQMEEHKKSLVNLKFTLNIFKKIEKFLNQYKVSPMQEFYLFEGHDTPLQLGVLPLCYVLKEYRLSKDDISMQSEHMAVPFNEIKQLGRQEQFQGIPLLSHHRCIHTILLKDSRSLSKEELLKICHWASQNGYKPQKSLYLTTVLSYMEHGSPQYYLELFLPIE